MENDPLIAQLEDLENSALFVQPKLLFTRPKVFVKTTADNRDGMPGFLSLIETNAFEHVLSWTPEASIPGLDDDAYVDISSQDHDVTAFIVPPRSPNSGRRSFHPSDYEVSIPLQAIYSLLVYPPRFKGRHGSIIVNLMRGESLPAFYFHDDGLASSKGKAPMGAPPSWGGEELLDQLEQLVDITGSAIEPGVYLVNASQADKINHGAASPPRPLSPKIQDHPSEDTTTSHEVHRGRSPSRKQEETTGATGSHITHSRLSPNGTTSTSTGAATGPIAMEGMRRQGSINRNTRDKSRDHQMLASTSEPSHVETRPRTQSPFEFDPLVNTVKEMRWNILERFSQVARLSRDAATSLLDHPITRTILPPHVQQRVHDSEAARKMMEDYDSARVYLARWAASVADQGDKELREKYDVGRPPSSSSTGKHRAHGLDGRRINDHEDEEGPLGAFNVLDPLTAMDWFGFLDDMGRLTVSEAHVREAVFRGGIEHDIRIEVWKFFLGIYPWDSTEVERVVIRATKLEEYYALKREWFEDPAVQQTEAFQEQKLRIEKDVHRTDRTISFFASETLPNFAGDFTGVGSNENLELLKDILLTYNVWAAKAPAVRSGETTSTSNKSLTSLSPDSKVAASSSAAGVAISTDPNLLEGYVQGMSDLLAPVFAVMGDEVMGFWAFVGLMEKTKRNFYRDQVGMQSQLEALAQLIHALDPKLYKHLEKCEALNLFFCFRWLLIWYKREFEWTDIMRLWEVLFSDHLSTQFQLFVAMAILDKHRDVMMDHLQGFDEILK
ncbi:GTPase activating protein, partial [Modicella reniformis]